MIKLDAANRFTFDFLEGNNLIQFSASRKQSCEQFSDVLNVVLNTRMNLKEGEEEEKKVTQTMFSQSAC